MPNALFVTIQMWRKHLNNCRCDTALRGRILFTAVGGFSSICNVAHILSRPALGLHGQNFGDIYDAEARPGHNN